MASTINITDIQLFKTLKKKLGEQEAEELVATKDFVEKKISEVEAKISEAKFQLILWAFLFGVTQLSAIFAFLNFFK